MPVSELALVCTTGKSSHFEWKMEDQSSENMKWHSLVVESSIEITRVTCDYLKVDHYQQWSSLMNPSMNLLSRFSTPIVTRPSPFTFGVFHVETDESDAIRVSIEWEETDEVETLFNKYTFSPMSMSIMDGKYCADVCYRTTYTYICDTPIDESMISYHYTNESTRPPDDCSIEFNSLHEVSLTPGDTPFIISLTGGNWYKWYNY